MEPVLRSERLAHLDALRGGALFGVLLMNLYWFSAPTYRAIQLRDAWPRAADGWTMVLGTVLLSGKAMTLFSLLFAMGLCIQLERAETRGLAFGPFVRRRLGALLGFGILHILLLWNGDILHAYALSGFLLLAFIRRQARTIWIWAAALWGFGLLAIASLLVTHALRPGPTLPTAAEVASSKAWADQCVAAYGHGTWLQILRFRLRDWAHEAPVLLVGGLGFAFLNILVGLGLWKTGIPRQPSAHLPLLRRVARWGLGLGLLAGLGEALLDTPAVGAWGPAHWSIYRWILPFRLLSGVQPLVLALGYGAGLLVLWQSERWRRRLDFLTWVGRMAFTNYLTQSLVMTGVFCHWGLGLYDRTGLALATLIGIGFYAIQALVSRWWLRRFLFGPLEWVWRCLSYGERQPFRQREAAAG
jgi:uncharacterized protein